VDREARQTQLDKVPFQGWDILGASRRKDAGTADIKRVGTAHYDGCRPRLVAPNVTALHLSEGLQMPARLRAAHLSEFARSVVLLKISAQLVCELPRLFSAVVRVLRRGVTRLFGRVLIVVFDR